MPFISRWSKFAGKMSDTFPVGDIIWDKADQAGWEFRHQTAPTFRIEWGAVKTWKDIIPVTRQNLGTVDYPWDSIWGNVIYANLLAQLKRTVTDDVELSKLSADPAVTEGQLWYRSDLKRLRYYDGVFSRSLVHLDEFNTHKTASPMDHPDGSVKPAKLSSEPNNLIWEYLRKNVRFRFLANSSASSWGNPAILYEPVSLADAAYFVWGINYWQYGPFGRGDGTLNNFYYFCVDGSRSSSDYVLGKRINGTDTIVSTVGVDVNLNCFPLKLQIVGQTATGFYPSAANTEFEVGSDCTVYAGTFNTITATVTELTSGYWGVLEYRHSGGGLFANVAGLLFKGVVPTATPPPPAEAYYEVPVVGSGTPSDPYRPQLPFLAVPLPSELVVRDPITGDVLKDKGNALAVTYSGILPVGPDGRPTSKTCVIKVCKQPDRQAHLYSLAEALSAIEAQVGTRKLDEAQARRRAKELDSKIRDEDLEGW
jgi:hypothetical protein